MFSLDNYDLKLSKQRAIPYVDALAGYAGSVDANFNIGNAYGTVFANGFIYAAISNTFPGIVRKIDPATGVVIADITVGDDPRGLCFDGQNIWCANYDLAGGGNTVSKIDVATDTVLSTLTVGINPAMIECDNIGNVWVACLGSTNTYKIDIATDAITVVGLGVQVKGLAFDNRAYMWFTNSTSTTMKKVRITTNAVSNVTAPTGTYGITSAAGYLWVTDFNTKIYKIDRVSLTVVKTFTTPHTPTRRPAFDGKRVWVPCGASGYTVVIDPETDVVVDAVNVGGGSNKCMTTDGTRAFISVDAGLARVPL